MVEHQVSNLRIGVRLPLPAHFDRGYWVSISLLLCRIADSPYPLTISLQISLRGEMDITTVCDAESAIKLSARSLMDRVGGFGPLGGGSTPPGRTRI